MKHLISFCLLLKVLNTSAQSIEWVNQMSNTNSNRATSVVTDAADNLYVLGYFKNSLTYDSLGTLVSMTSNGGSDIFIQKLNAKGEHIWMKQIGGSGTDEGVYITSDKRGNIYATSLFQGTVDFNPGPSNHNITARNVGSTIVKLDTSGNFIWAKGLVGTSVTYTTSLKIDDLGNLYCTGSFRDTTDFDPGPSAFQLISDRFSSDIFILKLDASGNFAWAKQMGATSYNNIGFSITTDSRGEVYTTGSFGHGTVDFDPGANTFNLTTTSFGEAIYIQKLDTNGHFVWAKQIDGFQGRSLRTDQNNNLYVAGQFRGTVDFDPGSATTYHLTAGNSGDDVFVLKLDANGDFVWAKNFGGNKNENTAGLTLDSKNNLYTYGRFRDTADFDPGPQISNRISYGGEDMFIQKLDSNGQFISVNHFGGSGFDLIYSVTSDSKDNIYACGTFSDTVYFHAGSQLVNRISLGGLDNFTLKLKDTTSIVTAVKEGSLSSNNISIYPNPTTNNRVNLVFENEQSRLAIRVYNKSGQLIKSNTAVYAKQVEIEIATVPGIYFMQIIDQLGRENFRKVVIK